MVAHGHKSTVSHLNEHFKDVPLQSLQQQQQQQQRQRILVIVTLDLKN